MAEMDEYVYQYLVPPAIQQVLEDEERFPPVSKRIATIDRVLNPKAEAVKSKRRKKKLVEALAAFDRHDLDADDKLNEEEIGEVCR